MKVASFPLKHGVACFGYRFEEKGRRRKFRKSVLFDHKLTPNQIQDALNGRMVYDSSGKLIHAETLFLPNPELRSYCYCTDTLAATFVEDRLEGVSMLYHEATYTHELVEKAWSRFHSTAKEAAEVARSNNVGKLIIGHYSSRYDDSQILLEEAQEVFSNTVAAQDGLRVNIMAPIPEPGTSEA